MADPHPAGLPAGRAPSVVQVLAPAPVGGLEEVVRGLASGLGARGWRVRVAAVLSPGRPLPTPLRDPGDGVTAVPLHVSDRAYGREWRLLREVIAGAGADVVHTHGYRSDVMGLLAARAEGAPTVATVHGFTGGGWRNRAYEWIQERALRRFDAVVPVSGSVAERLREAGVSPARLHPIRNAWTSPEPPLERAEARRALGLEPGGFHVGWVGRLSPEKGPDVALRAVAEVEEVTLSLIGAGPARGELEDLAGRLGVASRVRFHGQVEGAGRLFRAFDACALSSRTEGTPMVLLEAMAAGTPVVATGVGGVPDVVSAREALLVPPEDPGALADALRAVRNHPDAAADRAERARRRLADDFGPEPWLDAYEAVYRGVGAGPGPGRRPAGTAAGAR